MKRDAEKIERRLTEAYRSGEYDPWYDDPKTLKAKNRERLTLTSALDRFLDDKREQGRAERTIENYRGFIGRLIDEIGNHPLEALSPALLNEWIRAEDVTDTTRHSRYRYVNAFLNHCKRQGWADENPLDGTPAPSKQEKLPKTMYKQDLRRICEAVRADYRDKRQRDLCDPNEVIWRAWAFRFAFYTGLRGGELARLRFDHIDRERSLIYVLKQKNNKEQTIPLASKAEEVLHDVPSGAPNMFVFGGPGTRSGSRNFTAWRNNLSRGFRRYRMAAGIDRKISLHSLRHGFCTALAEAGKSAATIKECARHASIDTSMIYVKMSNEHLKNEMEDVF
jgi:integrase